MFPRVGLDPRGSIVTIGDAEARLGLLGDQAFPAGLELVDGDGLDHVPLPGYQHVDTLQRVVDALAEPCNLDIVSYIAMRRCLPRPNEGVIPLTESIKRCFQFVQAYICCGQPVVVLRLQPPSERAAQAGRALPKCERLGVVRVTEPFLDACDAFAGDLLLPSGQIIWARCGQHGLQTFGEVLALLDANVDPRIQFPELCVDLRQQRLVVLSAQPDDIVESIKAGLPGIESRPQVLEVEVIVQ